MKTKHHFTFATKESDYALLKETLAEKLSIELTDHESSWWGQYALHENQTSLSVKIYPNFVDGEGYHEKEKKDYPYLLEICRNNNPQQVNEIISNLPINFELVRHNEI